MTTYRFKNQWKTTLCFVLLFGITLGALLLESEILLFTSVLCLGVVVLSSALGFIGRKIDIIGGN